MSMNTERAVDFPGWARRRPPPGPRRERFLRWMGEWIRDLCLSFGSTKETAWKVAGVFIQGVENEWKKQEEKP